MIEQSIIQTNSSDQSAIIKSTEIGKSLCDVTLSLVEYMIDYIPNENINNSTSLVICNDNSSIVFDNNEFKFIKGLVKINKAVKNMTQEIVCSTNNVEQRIEQLQNNCVEIQHVSENIDIINQELDSSILLLNQLNSLELIKQKVTRLSTHELTKESPTVEYNEKAKLAAIYNSNSNRTMNAEVKGDNNGWQIVFVTANTTHVTNLIPSKLPEIQKRQITSQFIVPRDQLTPENARHYIDKLSEYNVTNDFIETTINEINLIITGSQYKCCHWVFNLTPKLGELGAVIIKADATNENEIVLDVKLLKLTQDIPQLYSSYQLRHEKKHRRWVVAGPFSSWYTTEYTPRSPTIAETELVQKRLMDCMELSLNFN